MARNKYGYAETSDIKATVAGHIYSITNDTLAIENGTLWKLGNLKTPNEIYDVTKPAVGDKVVLAHSALYNYDTKTTLGQHEMYLRKEAGEVARAYELVEHDRYAISIDMIKPLATTPVVGNHLVLKADTGTYEELATATATNTYGFVARINSIEHKANLTLVRIEVIKNEQVGA